MNAQMFFQSVDFVPPWKEVVDTVKRVANDLLTGLMLAVAFNTTLRNNRLNQVTTDADSGASAAVLRIYSGTRPATGGTATTLLAELTMSDPSFGSAASGVLTASSITADSSANATGTATWGRLLDSDSNFVMDFDVGTSGSDLNLNTVSIVSGVQVSVSSLTLTEGNP